MPKRKFESHGGSRKQPAATLESSSFLVDQLPDELLSHVAKQLHSSWEGARMIGRQRGSMTELERYKQKLLMSYVEKPVGTPALDLRATCRSARDRLAPLLEAYKQLSLVPSLCRGVSRGVRTISAGEGDAWACCKLLPSTGRSCWSVRVDGGRLACNDDGQGRFYVGVCTADGRCAWGLLPAAGHMRRWSRDAHGHVGGAPPPAGYPRGHLTQVLYDEEGRPSDLKGDTKVGCSIEVVFDADQGTLGYRINGGPLLPALTGFPSGVGLRPWARTVVHETLCFVPAFDRGDQ